MYMILEGADGVFRRTSGFRTGLRIRESHGGEDKADPGIGLP